jgi:hypothetical protein
MFFALEFSVMLNLNIKNLVFFDIFFAAGDYKANKKYCTTNLLGKKTIS